MIIKSMSRKEPSFGQLAAYLSSEKADANYDLYLNCFSKSHGDIAAEFFENSRLLSKRRNGNYLYHEIISFKVEENVDAKHIKDGLREAVDLYVAQRCPRNMVYGCLHQDHEHNLHYHLMISANERGEAARLRLTQKQFDGVKRNLETHVLEHYPQLKQKQLITASRQTEKMSVKAGEMKRRSGKLPVREEIKQTIQSGMLQTSNMNNFIFFLSERGYQFYSRGKNFGVQVEHENGKVRKYRFSTLGIHEAFVEFESAVNKQGSMSENEGEKKHEKQDVSQAESKVTPNEQKTSSETAKDAGKNTNKGTAKSSAKKSIVKESSTKNSTAKQNSKEHKTEANPKPDNVKEQIKQTEQEFSKLTDKKSSGQSKSQKSKS